MQEEKTQLLFSRYPEIFGDHDKDVTETCMCWGFECGDGWYDLIDDLCLHIMNYCDSNGVDYPVASQVKEKFGTLSFYVWSSDDKTDRLISEAEKRSSLVCEVCGDDGKTKSKHSWLKTVCEKHAEEFEYE